MQRKLNHDDFEQFLKESAEDLRMKPSPAVWNAINQELNRKRRRFLGLVVMTLGLASSLYFSWYALHFPHTEPAASLPAVIQTQLIHSASAPAATSANTVLKSPAISTTKSKTRKYSGTTTAIPAVPPPAQTATATFQTPDIENQELAVSAAPQSTVLDQEAFNLEDLITLSDEQKAATLPVMPLSLERSSLPEASLNNHNLAATTPISEAAADAIVASLKKSPKKVSWMFFATPTISYRKLTENKDYQREFLTPGTPPMVSALFNLNNSVVHKPDLGLEFGTAARYTVSPNLKLRTGFQFNISRYDIKAFNYVPEVTTIALNNGVRVDSVRAISSYRNFNGGRSNWLQNFYFQASLPVGLELKVAGNNKFQWSLASSIQPTYVIGNRAYLITADYKNYARVPWLTRRWNMNTSLETFLTYDAGKTQWHIGPQVRYQLMSSFVNEYPVKEYLFDYGLKVGITLK